MDYNKLLKTKDTLTEKLLKDPINNIPSLKEAIDISIKFDVPLHPHYLLYINELSIEDFVFFTDFFVKNVDIASKKINNSSRKFKRFLEIIGLEHKQNKDNIILTCNNFDILLVNLGINPFCDNFCFEMIYKHVELLNSFLKSNDNSGYILNELISKKSFIKLKDKSGTYVGARMGRPEKARMRSQVNQDKKVHSLFPSGFNNNSQNLKDLFDKGSVEDYFKIYYCKHCNKETIFRKCKKCKNKCIPVFFGFNDEKMIDELHLKNIIEKICNDVNIDIDKTSLINLNAKRIVVDEKNLEILKVIFGQILLKYPNLRYKAEIENIIKYQQYKKISQDISFCKNELDELSIDNVKLIKNIFNKNKHTEELIKGVLRNKYNLFLNKDATIRYDMTQMGITHFKPCEIGTSIEKLVKLGYECDYLGKKLENDNQIIEIFPQDIILPDCVEDQENSASDFVIRTACFIDELLEKLYELKAFYNFKTKEDTIGTLIVGIAPHISSGTTGRIIGYSKTQTCLAHPLWHASQRRNLDGDETGIILLLDLFINFSQDFLTDKRGARTMDTVLTLTSNIDLEQVDNEVFSLDINSFFPKAFYDYAKLSKNYDHNIIKLSFLKEKLLLKDDKERFNGHFFTHSTFNFNEYNNFSAYKSLESMNEKIDAEMILSNKIRAVDETEVATMIMQKHLLRDIKNNLLNFSKQSFRCANCNNIIRRVPLNAKCPFCNADSIMLTDYENSVKKYVPVCEKLIKENNVNGYVKAIFNVAEKSVKMLFKSK